MTITVIGSGKVGASAALNCGLRELDDVLLLDIVQGLPQGEAMDINHQLSERGSDSVARGSNNYEDMRGSDYVVLVAGVGRKPGMTRMDLLKINAGIVKDVASKIATYAKDATVIVVTNPLDPMTYLALKTIGAQKSKVMGMGGMLDLSRFKSYIQEATGVSRDSIQAMVISEHGENMLPLTRFSSLGGIPLHDFITKEQATDIFEKTKKVAAEVIALKGATVYAPGNAVATMIESMAKDKKMVIPVSAYLDGQYGVSDLCIGVPAVIGAGGVEKIVELKLDSFEQGVFDKGVASVREAIKALPL
ncbi:malate dehydrogenase (NAD) [Candidatus Nitrososphaera evergladensis SR1]|uniref:Malate dehydrogenase n=1 Tax=Candidatus Nitrososphaera evergladensis SR1 TaxID=1459636 RepID=A0A075MUF8_9ARCH|nr:malate dehydrogenase [Candidatus Nitrososphaera evergladensis]AIF84840.1 malate dehydrogenase (NAD) [Candidatus Nitrososphaera evergladensis SR1]